ncbi:hypothetical protein PSN45_001526 [Yamadazyma tenuis]|uniref:Nucleoside phosphatase GDA1/CD39 n=1 Tax=Candida tenuis (strain ATCC 10573 / BCRC 21748 / CBS 615 / JCM 9827 / NBRC 10315 / NRRL Y-1498 / VKM Y-70) TaxID=590646 RepID=G3BFI0_CANTC|nr:uncharacterized protein CANTEDRAFT_111440 [Yamadazyma tenuis ATCC 10573]EGV60697.1 hypothetical protein CANTEDRAFT_111440 [Yamadazyma tenuis ATCC 10573]WEJ94048.1 hypothetical protein PSN45_001526 [Yamadazyma tenuis]
MKKGPIANSDNIPYDYIVIIDSGSKGSRVFVYNWLNPSHALKGSVDLNQYQSFKDFKLVKSATTQDNGTTPESDDEDQDNSDSDSDSDPDSNSGSKPQKQKQKPTKQKSYKARLPKVNSNKKWKHKVKPGISTFNLSPQKIGNHHLRPLLAVASRVVPKSQHHRTPIFLHSTAGMRLLTPTEQQKILDTVCEYFQSNSDFFLPDCASHINVIEGDVEGLYGWLAINYLVGAFDDPQNHQHGKNHTTYGLLDMGGASTQVVFQPNHSEITEHQNNLYNVSLCQLPKLKHSQPDNAVGKYLRPSPLAFSVYSDSFLGLGMSQAYTKFLGFLVANSPTKPGVFYNPPISDPCLPKGYVSNLKLGDDRYDFTGDSNFETCLNSIFPILSQSSYRSSSPHSGNCKQDNDDSKVSSCLLNDLIPAFDFDINHFYGVSGYWYAISTLMSYNQPQLSPRVEKHPTDTEYDYKVISENTKNICSKSYSELIDLNKMRPESQQLSTEELTNLCFKSSWILNFLHLGLGFPRFGIDEIKQDDKFKSLRLVDKIKGSEFSWTLGRAILYANDEYVEAFNNYTSQNSVASPSLLARAGFTYTPSPNSFHYGSEQNGVAKRPQFVKPVPNAKYNYYDYEKSSSKGKNESKWDIEPHRWYGGFMFLVLLSLIFWLLLGSKGRSRIVVRIKNDYQKAKDMVSSWTNHTYQRVSDVEIGEYQLQNLEVPTPSPPANFVIGE